jgi:hypothetical protein
MIILSTFSLVKTLRRNCFNRSESKTFIYICSRTHRSVSLLLLYLLVIQFYCNDNRQLNEEKNCVEMVSITIFIFHEKVSLEPQSSQDLYPPKSVAQVSVTIVVEYSESVYR